MITFDLNDEQQLIYDSARRFAQENIAPAAPEAAREGVVPVDLVTSFAQLGLGLASLSEAVGGQGQSLVTTAVVAETLSCGDAGLAMALPQPGAFGRLIEKLGSPSQAADYLKAFSEQPMTAQGAVVLGHGIKARRQGDGYILHGKHEHVWQAARSQHLLVLAQLHEERGLAGVGAFVVPRASAGVELGGRLGTLGLEVLHASSVVLRDVRVAASARLGSGDLTAALDLFFATEGLLVAAHAVGTSRAAFNYALDYAKGRRAFGKPVAHFQSIAFLLSDMLIQLESAHLSVLHAAWAHDAGAQDALRLMCSARALADEAAFFITDNAVQVLGGHGYIQDHPVEKWMRDARTLALTLGSRESADCRAAAALVEPQHIPETLPWGSLQPVWS